MLCAVTHVTDEAEDDYDEAVADVDNVAIGNHFILHHSINCNYLAAQRFVEAEGRLYGCCSKVLRSPVVHFVPLESFDNSYQIAVLSFGILKTPSHCVSVLHFVLFLSLCVRGINSKKMYVVKVLLRAT